MVELHAALQREAALQPALARCSSLFNLLFLLLLSVYLLCSGAPFVP
jgi:hypothetical protein